MERFDTRRRVTVAEALASLPGPGGERFRMVFQHGSLQVEFYAPRGNDPQQPHSRDEAYIVSSGRGVYVSDAGRQPCGPGDFLFAPAGVEHRFEDFTADFAVWVLFYGPDGGEHQQEMAAANHFGHIDLRVPSMGAVLPFYEKLLPGLGFTRRHSDHQWQVFYAGGKFPGIPFLGITEDPEHLPNKNRIAFWVDSPEEVDRLAELIQDAGAREVEGPRDCPEYTSTYYAVFFQDPCGNRLEVYHRTS